ncbi:hypothetical protein GJ496_007294 [Pomphorhynchus laevis]|nr:hypothetical protein GJ496_007294 [Pomphorhynchus laevis]
MSQIESCRGCVNSPDVYCYACREYTLVENRLNITDFVARAYLTYLAIKLGDQDKYWAPHSVCKQCINICDNGNCYFCAQNFKVINRANRQTLIFHNLTSSMRPVPHSEELPAPDFSVLFKLSLSSSDEDFSHIDVDKDAEFSVETTPKLFS